jgi:hypothetical protein
MHNHRSAEVLVREGIRQPAVATVAPATYPLSPAGEAQHDDILAQIGSMRSELTAGNVAAAVKIGHLVGGRSARLGERRVASLVRKAVIMSRFYVLEQAGDVLAQAESELISKN